MTDPRTTWLVVTNIALGLAVLLLIVLIVCGTCCDCIGKLRHRRAMMKEMDADLHQAFAKPPRK